MYAGEAPSYGTVKTWFNEFNCGLRSLKVEVREGRPNTTADVLENIDAVRELIMQDRHVPYREIEASLDIKNFCSRWIPQTLKKGFVLIGVKKRRKNKMVVPQKTFIRSSHVTNHYYFILFLFINRLKINYLIIYKIIIDLLQLSKFCCKPGWHSGKNKIIS